TLVPNLKEDLTPFSKGGNSKPSLLLWKSKIESLKSLVASTKKYAFYQLCEMNQCRTHQIVARRIYRNE
ncbi:hypothetical protein, partial [Lancefieldella rimae]